LREPALNTPRLAPETAGTVLARLSLPYEYPSGGTIAGHDFASIHSSPPWNDLDNPVIVEHEFGRGRCIYSAATIEAADTEANGKLFAALIVDLLDSAPTLDAATHPNVWITAFDQPDRNRLMLAALRYETEPTTGSVPVTVRYRPPADRTVLGVRHALSGAPRPHTHATDGTVEFALGDLELFDMFLVDYEPVGP
jgi:hypothetical protein